MTKSTSAMIEKMILLRLDSEMRKYAIDRRVHQSGLYLCLVYVIHQALDSCSCSWRQSSERELSTFLFCFFVCARMNISDAVDIDKEFWKLDHFLRWANTFLSRDQSYYLFLNSTHYTLSGIIHRNGESLWKWLSKWYWSIFTRESCLTLTHYDWYVDMRPMLIDRREQIDEKDCGSHFLCDNQFTQCDGFWNCINGVDEANCQSSLCPPFHHPCVSSANNTVGCLPLELAGDSKVHCRGGADERH